MGTITANDTYSKGDDAVFRGTYDVEYAEVEVTVDNSSMPGPPDNTVLTGKCLGGEFHIPFAPVAFEETVIKTGDTGGITAGNTYNITPLLLQCKNGDILCIYGTGTDHRSIEDNIVYKRLTLGSDYETGWGSETLIATEATHGARISGGGHGVDPKTGRVMLFYLVMGQVADDFELYNYYYIYSDDNGYTWSTPVDLYPQFQAAGTSLYPSRYPVVSPDTNPDPRAFGRIERCIHGLLTLVYVPFKAIVAVFSYDNGETWDIENGVTVDNLSSGYELLEPNLVKIDEYTFVAITRDDNSDNSASWSKTTDGGLTWTSFVAPTAFYSGITPTAASACQGMRVGNRVYGYFTAREPAGVHVQTCVSVDEFVSNPADLWSTTKNPQERYEYIISPDGQYLNAGYGSIIPISGHEYTALIAYYIPVVGSATETAIALSAMFRV